MKSTENSGLNFEQIIVLKSVSGLKFVKSGPELLRPVVAISEICSIIYLCGLKKS